MIVHRAWIAGLATSLLLGVAPGDAEPAAESTIYAGTVVLDEATAERPVDVVGVGWGTRYRDPEMQVTEGVATLGVRVRPLESLWLVAGAGGALDDQIGVLPGAMVGGGYLLGPVEVSVHAGTGVDGAGNLCAYHASLGLGVAF